MTEYFIYSRHLTRQAAVQALEDYSANGEICEAEMPRIETKRMVGRDQTALYRTFHCVMFPGA